MALKKKSSGGGGANWMDTYGDMVTLLLCFFVLLYSMSSISEEKYAALVMSFNPMAQQTITPIPDASTDGPSSDPGESGVAPTDNSEDRNLKTQEEIDADIAALFQSLQEFTQSQSQNIMVQQGGGKIYISFNQAVFFDGESSVLRPESYPVLDSVIEMLTGVKSSIDEIRVLGHTAQASANRPNRVSVDRSLASERATNVVIYIQEHSQLDPGRLISEGIGQWRPVASNDTSEGRAANRRVEMIISGRDLAAEQFQQAVGLPGVSVQ